MSLRQEVKSKQHKSKQHRATSVQPLHSVMRGIRRARRTALRAEQLAEDGERLRRKRRRTCSEGKGEKNEKDENVATVLNNDKSRTSGEKYYVIDYLVFFWNRFFLVVFVLLKRFNGPI